MKIVRTVFLVFFLILINVSNTWAETTPPSPDKFAKTSADDDEEPCPTCDVVPPLPIDEHLLLLGISAVLLGATVIYKQTNIKKALAKS